MLSSSYKLIGPLIAKVDSDRQTPNGNGGLKTMLYSSWFYISCILYMFYDMCVFCVYICLYVCHIIKMKI